MITSRWKVLSDFLLRLSEVLLLVFAVVAVVLLHGDDDVAEGFFAFAVGGDVAVALECGVDHAALVGVHCLEGLRSSGSLDLGSYVLGEVFERLLAALAVVLGVSLDVDVSVEALVHDERDEILERIQRLAALADEDAHVVAFDFDREDVVRGIEVLIDRDFHAHRTKDVCEKLDKGVLDFAIIMSYVDLAKYNYLPLPASDTWGVIMRRDDPLSDRSSLSVRDLIGLPLLCSRQWLDQDFPQWFGLETEDANIVATWNLTYNASVMVKTGMGYAITYDKLADTSENSELAFVPLRGVPQSDIFIIWRKNQAFSPAARLLLDTLRQTFRPDPDEI